MLYKEIKRKDERVKPMRIKSKLAVLLSFVLVISMLYGNWTNWSVPVLADSVSGGDLEIVFDTDPGHGDYTKGTIQYLDATSDAWTSVDAGSNVSVKAKAVKVVGIQDGYELESHVYLRVNGNDILSDEAVRNAFLSEDAGYTLEDGVGYRLENFTFQSSAISTDPVDPSPVPSANTGDVAISIANGQNGVTEYKIGGGEWQRIESSPFTLRGSDELSGVTSGTAIYFRAKANEGRALDEHDRQNLLSVSNEDDTSVDVAALKSDSGWSFTYDPSKAYNLQIKYEGAEEPGQDENHFSGVAYFTWQGANDAICIYRVVLSEEPPAINYIPVSAVKDMTNNEQFVISNRNYAWIWEDQIDLVRTFPTWTAFKVFLDNEDNLRAVAINPLDAEDGESTICTNGDYNFRATIYAEAIYEGVAFSQNENDYTYFPDFWDEDFHTSTVDITATTPQSPAEFESFLLEPTIHFAEDTNSANAFISIRALNVPDGAVTVTGDPTTGFDVRFASNFFDDVTFEVATASGNYYLKIVRTALQLSDDFAPGNTDRHIVADMYFDSGRSYTDYEIYATIHYSDGSTSMQKVDASAFTDDGLGNPVPPGTYVMTSGKNLKKAHYLVPYSSDIVSVDFNAIMSGALSGNTYGGSFFGSEKGVTYDVATRSTIY